MQVEALAGELEGSDDDESDGSAAAVHPDDAVAALLHRVAAEGSHHDDGLEPLRDHVEPLPRVIDYVEPIRNDIEPLPHVRDRESDAGKTDEFFDDGQGDGGVSEAGGGSGRRQQGQRPRGGRASELVRHPLPHGRYIARFSALRVEACTGARAVLLMLLFPCHACCTGAAALLSGMVFTVLPGVASSRRSGHNHSFHHPL